MTKQNVVRVVAILIFAVAFVLGMRDGRLGRLVLGSIGYCVGYGWIEAYVFGRVIHTGRAHVPVSWPIWRLIFLLLGFVVAIGSLGYLAGFDYWRAPSVN